MFCFFLGKHAHRLKRGFAAERAFLEITGVVSTASPHCTPSTNRTEQNRTELPPILPLSTVARPEWSSRHLSKPLTLSSAVQLTPREPWSLLETRSDPQNCHHLLCLYRYSMRWIPLFDDSQWACHHGGEELSPAGPPYRIILLYRGHLCVRDGIYTRK